MVLGMKIANQRLILSEDFFLDNTCFENRNFRTNSHENITLIIAAIAARDKLTHKYLASDE